MLRDTEWVNARTGETGQAFLVIKGKKYPRGLAFETVFAAGWRDLATWRDPDGRRLTGTEWTVFAGLMAHLGFENVIAVCQATLADELGIAQPNVARAVKRLEQAGFIARGKDAGDPRRTVYRLSPNLAWRGDAGGWHRAIQARARAGRTRPADEDIDAFLSEHGFADGAAAGSQAAAAPAEPADAEPATAPGCPDRKQEDLGARRVAGVRA